MATLEDELRQGHVDNVIIEKVAKLVKSLHQPATIEQEKSVEQKKAIYQKLFVDPFQLEALPTGPAADYIKRASFNDFLTHIKEKFNVSLESQCHGQIMPEAIKLNGSDIQVDLNNLFAGPAGFDLGTLLAHYIFSYHQLMLTPENNFENRQASYKMVDAIRLTGDLFFDGVDEATSKTIIATVCEYLSLELIYLSLLHSGSASLSKELLDSARRVINVRQPIDSTGRLLLISLMLIH